MRMGSRAQIIDGKAIAERIGREARRRLEALKRSGGRVRVGVVLASGDPAASLYVERQKARFTEAGIECLVGKVEEERGEEGVLALVGEFNRDPGVTGIVVALPLARGVDVRKVQEAISPRKDVEGVHPSNLGKVVLGKRRTGPCTAQAVLEILEHAAVPLEGTEAVVVGHSEIVGKPVALGLMERLATVTVCHVATRELAFHTRRADVLVVAVGKRRLITGDMVKEGAAVVDVGINRVTGEDGRSRTVGDVDFETVAERARWITPVPGGVGPVTVAVLLRSAVEAAGG